MKMQQIESLMLEITTLLEKRNSKAKAENERRNGHKRRDRRESKKA